MKSAILIYGMYREFDICINHWDKVEEYYDCDYYFSTWDKSKQKYSNDESFKEFDVTPNMITNYLPNCSYDILDENLIFPIKPTQPSSNQLLFHWKNVYNMMLKSGKEYDMVILLRSDSILKIKMSNNINPKDWVKINHKDLFGSDIKVINSNPYEFIIDDILFMGNMDMIGKLINKIPDTTNIDEIIHSHFWIADTLLSMNIIPNSNFPFSAAYIRPKL